MSDDIEAEVRACCDAGDIAAATGAALRGYGPEVYSFLVARMQGEDRAGDVFSQTSEDLWSSLATFQWRCSMRTWMYKLARNAAQRYTRNPANRAGKHVGLTQVSHLIDQVRSRTVAHLRTEVKDEFARLRERLDPEDQTLLVLRVDRGLEWTDIARVMADAADPDGDDLDADPAALTRASARHRQRFQKVKERLRDLAQEAGLLDRNDG